MNGLGGETGPGGRAGGGALTALATRLPGARVAVLGDVMLDEYLWGTARAAPVAGSAPVIHLSQRRAAPGGAANVAAGIIGLGGLVRLGGVLGTDTNGAVLADTLRAGGVATDGLLTVEGRPTTTKNRILTGDKEMLRLDIEDPTPLGQRTEAKLLSWLEANLPIVGAVVLSDYAKGTITEPLARAAIGAAMRRDVPVVVDPKATDFTHYRGATVITPTVREAERACWIDIVDEASLHRAATALMTQLDGTAVLITRGRDGMSLFGPHADPVHIAPTNGKALDATGAGDTVAAAIALSLAAGGDLLDAVRLATLAAGVVVGKFGTAVATLDDVMAAI